jgi:hypothetical protein
MLKQSFVEHLRVARQTLKPSDRWTGPLRNIRGQVGHDGLERISTEAIFEHLDLPPLKRTPDAGRRIRIIMLELGWTPVRARAVTARGRAARVRGYARAQAMCNIAIAP